jgi:hypothetical protein
MGPAARHGQALVSPEALFRAALTEAFGEGTVPIRDVIITYELANRHLGTGETAALTTTLAALIVQAAARTRAGGRIWVAAREYDGLIELAVGDDGPVVAGGAALLRSSFDAGTEYGVRIPATAFPAPPVSPLSNSSRGYREQTAASTSRGRRAG